MRTGIRTILSDMKIYWENSEIVTMNPSNNRDKYVITHKDTHRVVYNAR